MFPTLLSSLSPVRRPTTVFDPLLDPEALLDTLRGGRLTVKETAAGYEALLDLPGFARDEIEVTLDGDVVSVRAVQTATQAEQDGERVLYNERRQRKVWRAFRLPQPVAFDQGTAELSNGVLKLVLPRAAANKARLEVKDPVPTPTA